MSSIYINGVLIDKENNWWTCQYVDNDPYGRVRKIGKFPEIIKEEWKKNYEKFIAKIENEAKINPQIIFYNLDGPIMYENAKDKII